MTMLVDPLGGQTPTRAPNPDASTPGSSGTMLFLAVNGPLDFARHVHGSYRRMHVFAEGLVRAGYRIEFLFFPRIAASEARAEARRVELELQRHWGLAGSVELCARGSGARTRAATYWSEYGAPVLSAARNPAFDDLGGEPALDAVRRGLARAPAAIFATGLESMLALARMRGPLPPIYYDIDDIEHVQFRREIRTLPGFGRRVLLHCQMPALERAERRALARAHKAFVCSESDRAYLAARFGATNVAVVPNAAAIAPLPARSRGSLIVLFVGFLGYQPNRDAVELLCSAIWPRIRARLPTAELHIVGDRAETHPRFAAPPPGVRFLGFVDDIAACYAKADVVCCPIHTGGGTRVKLVEAAAYASVIVSTTVGAEGLDFVDGVHALIRDDVESFAAACAELLLDPDRAQRLGAEARNLASARYSRDAVVAQVAGFCRPA